MAGPGVSLDFGSAGVTPMALVKQARQDAKQNRRARGDDLFDEIWCVFDRDEHPRVERALREARDSGIDTALSIPCIELWLVLHVESQMAHIHRNAIQRRCRDLGLVDGKALVSDAIPKLIKGYPEAKERAQALGKMHEECGSPAGDNPSSGMWRLVDRLRG